MLTLKEVAKAAGVSSSTVSAVLRDQGDKLGIKESTRRLVRETVKTLGYARNDLARSMVTGKTRVLGFITPQMGNEHTARVLDGVMRAAVENDYFVKVFLGRAPDTPTPVGLSEKRLREALRSQRMDDMRDVVEKCRRQRLDGVVAYGLGDGAYLTALAERLRACGIRFAIAGDSLDVPGCDQFLADNRLGGQLMFEHLHGLGHRRIVALEEYPDASWAQARLDGFHGAAARTDARVERIEINPYRLNKFAPGEATAVYCITDYTALGVVSLLQREGVKVPEDISVTGFGNLGFSNFSKPRITSVDEHLLELGRLAVSRMIEAEKRGDDLNDDKKTIRETRPVELVIKESTAAPKHQPVRGGI